MVWEHRKNPPRRPPQTRGIKVALITLAAKLLGLHDGDARKATRAQGDSDLACPVCDHPFGHLSRHACVSGWPARHAADWFGTAPDSIFAPLATFRMGRRLDARLAHVPGILRAASERLLAGAVRPAQQRPGVDADLLAGHVATLVTSEEHPEVGDVLGLHVRNRHGLEEAERKFGVLTGRLLAL